MPVGPRDAVHRAWKLHAGNVRHALVNGIYQGWDLHPAQLPSRYTAVFAFFLEGLAPASERLKNFVQKAAQATLAERVRHGTNGLLFSTAEQLSSVLFDFFEGFPGDDQTFERLRIGARKSARMSWDEGWTREAEPVLLPGSNGRAVP